MFVTCNDNKNIYLDKWLDIKDIILKLFDYVFLIFHILVTNDMNQCQTIQYRNILGYSYGQWNINIVYKFNYIFS